MPPRAPRRPLVLVEREDDWPFSVPELEVLPARTYVAGDDHPPRTLVLNFCRRVGYQKLGYYVSLLAEARGHRVWPDVTTIQDLKHRSVLRVLGATLGPAAAAELDAAVGSAGPNAAPTATVFLGRCLDGRFPEAAQEIFERVPAPCLEVRFARDPSAPESLRWRLDQATPKRLTDLDPAQRDTAERALRAHVAAEAPSGPALADAAYELAILHDPAEKEPPSDPEALARFVEAAARIGVRTTFITKDDYARLPQFDALFLRETTAVSHHTYRFARRAEADGLAVLDDPQSIFKCCNKVFLAEALRRAAIPTPPTLLVDRTRVERIVPTLGLPAVLKVPDSAFSMGVFRCDDEAEVVQTARRLLDRSDLIVPQGYVRSDFDWRVGVFEGVPLWACRYYMAPGHWQIVRREATGALEEEGAWDTIAVEDAPPAIVETALQAAACIGDGLYGVDLKEVDGRPLVVEVNDNPSLEADVEDAVLGPALYGTIVEGLVRRLERRRGLRRENGGAS